MIPTKTTKFVFNKNNFTENIIKNENFLQNVSSLQLEKMHCIIFHFKEMLCFSYLNHYCFYMSKAVLKLFRPCMKNIDLLFPNLPTENINQFP